MTPIQPDPKQFEAGDYNLYRYCHNDPVNKSDPFGLLERDEQGNPVESFFKNTEVTQFAKTWEVAKVFLTLDNKNTFTAYRNLTSDSSLNSNCIGYTFADGKYWINPALATFILEGDGYSATTTPKVGDVAIYTKDNEAVHSVRVSGTDKDGKLLGTGKAGSSSQGVTTKPIAPGPGGAWEDKTAEVTYYHQEKKK